MNASTLLNGTEAIWILFCVCILCFGKTLNNSARSSVLFLGGFAMLVAAFLGWQQSEVWSYPTPLYLVVAPLSNRIDAISAIFVGLLSVITMSVAFFSPGYLAYMQKEPNNNLDFYWVELFLFILGMLGVVIAANALTFLLFWEIMSVASALLIATNLASHEAKKASFIYLAATRIATAFLTAGFLLMFKQTGSWVFADWTFAAPSSTLPAFLILIAFCIKSGIWPFHDWLPYAHPAAPSPVSALMSGVMIKVSLYALIRLLVLGGMHAPLLSYLILTLGLISAFWGVLFALMQHDLKTLLAYHSIENVGLILLSIGLSLLSFNYHWPVVAGMSLAAAIFHCVNHGLFKSLLFLGAGTIDCRVHTRDLEKLGGIAKSMPWTMLFFLIGSAAICCLPPLNGFNSKWLVYQSLVQFAFKSHSFWLAGLALACIALLALVSGMALYCFTKAVGISFLGRARTRAAEHAREGSLGMVVSQGLLALCCIFLGVGAPFALSAIQPVVSSAFSIAADIENVYMIPMHMFALTIVLMSILLYWSFLKDRLRSYITWECGFGDLDKRMQGTASSFAENVGYTFAPLFHYQAQSIITGKDRRNFPEQIVSEVHADKLLESRVYAPVVRMTTWLGQHVMRLQTGSVHLYLSYFLLTLVALMVVGIAL